MLEDDLVIGFIKDELLTSPEVEYEWVTKITNLAAVNKQMYDKLSHYMCETDPQIRNYLYKQMKAYYTDFFLP